MWIGYFFRSSKMRKPAWCDRILWKEKLKEKARVHLLAYNSFQDYLTSDHKPIRADFQIDLEVNKVTFTFLKLAG